MIITVVSENWQPYDRGETIGKQGSESGTVVVDDEHPSGARITLERNGRVPFAITCGVYGWMVHTRFFMSRAEADDALRIMKDDLADLASNPSRERCDEFVDRHP